MTFDLTRRALLALTSAAALTLSAGHALAEPGAWSDEPVRIVVTFPPGGTSDLVARLLAKHLDEAFGQKAVVASLLIFSLLQKDLNVRETG